MILSDDNCQKVRYGLVPKFWFMILGPNCYKMMLGSSNNRISTVNMDYAWKFRPDSLFYTASVLGLLWRNTGTNLNLNVLTMARQNRICFAA